MSSTQNLKSVSVQQTFKKGYYAKWPERQASKQTLKKHEAAYQLKFEIREKIREAIYNRVIEWSVGF